jgi:N-acetylglucosamine-6-phosphate deacetylase
MDCIRTVVKEMHIPLESAVRCATLNPAKSIGIDDKYGSLEEGKYANAVVLDKDLNIVSIIQKGQVK